MTSKLQAIKDTVETLDREATAGPWITGSIPWKVWANGGSNTVCEVEAVGDAIQVVPGVFVSDSMAANRDFIAFARTALPDLVRLAEELEARLSVAETALSGLSDAVTLRLAHPSAKEARLRLWEAHKQATAALAEIMVTPPPDRKDGGIPNETGL